MNRFELFTMIFYALDTFYDDNPSDELGQFLSEMSPFTFTDNCSADPAVFNDFCKVINNDTISINASYDVAVEYLSNVKFNNLVDAFKTTSKEKWVSGCKKYLASEHKGANGDI